MTPNITQSEVNKILLGEAVELDLFSEVPYDPKKINERTTEIILEIVSSGNDFQGKAMIAFIDSLVDNMSRQYHAVAYLKGKLSSEKYKYLEKKLSSFFIMNKYDLGTIDYRFSSIRSTIQTTEHLEYIDQVFDNIKSVIFKTYMLSELSVKYMIICDLCKKSCSRYYSDSQLRKQRIAIEAKMLECREELNTLEIPYTVDDVTVELVKTQYRKLSMACHPDKIGGDGVEFRKVKDAYDKVNKVFFNS